MNKTLLKKVVDMMPVSSDDATRYHINGVYVESIETKGKYPEVTLTATNGHCLITQKFTDQRMPLGKYIFQRDQLSALKIILKECKNFDELEATITPEKGLFLGVFTKVKVEKSDSYPDYKQVIPTHSMPVSIALNADYLIRVGKALARYDMYKTANVRIEFDPTDPGRPILVYGVEENALGVVMPVRDPKAKTISDTWKEKKAALTVVA